jgi:hypothetical protein
MSNLNTRISKVIKEFFNAAKLFTLLDVSNAVKADGLGFVSHTDIREAANPIVNMIVGNGYLKEEISVKTPRGPNRAMLYYPANSNPNDYLNRDQVASNVGTASQVVAATSTLSPAGQVRATNSQTIAQKAAQKAVAAATASQTVFATAVRNDGKVEIPVAALQAAGLLNEDANFTFHPNSITIEAGTSRKLYSGIRLGTQSLAKSNLAANKVLKFTAFNKKIVVSHA